MVALKFLVLLHRWRSAGGLHTVLLRYGLGPKVFLHSDGIISASLDPTQDFSQTL